jgi:UTP--glucose-1-phosphate uridylyltransferase
VAGLGTRLLPATKATPKELLPVFDRPALAWVVAEAVEAGITELVLVTHRTKSAIARYFAADPELEATLDRAGKPELLREVRGVAAGARIVSVRQDRPLGLGHAVFCAAPFVSTESFAVLLPDHLLPVSPLRRLLDAQAASGGAAIALAEVTDPGRFGVIEGERRGDHVTVRRLVEKPPPGEAPSNLGIVGRYVLPADILPVLAALTPGRGGEIQLTDALAVLAAARRLQGFRIDGPLCDTGDALGLLEASLRYALASSRGDEVRSMIRGIG